MKRFRELINSLPLAIAVTLVMCGVMALIKDKPETLVRVLQTLNAPRSQHLKLVSGNIYEGIHCG
jgi:hypothetical protein